jgi:chromate transport protein ChrA
LHWTSRRRQIASIVLVVAAIVALFAFDVSWLFWVLVAASLVIVALDSWERRRLDR